jgi:glycosyltransferase involved in cell wall biosynthesis
MIVLSHPTGNANVRAVLGSLASKKLLSRFYTTIAAFPGNIWYRLGGIVPLAEFRRRSFDPVLQPYTHLYPWWEVGRAFASKVGGKRLLAHETGLFSIDQIYRAFDRHVAAGLPAAARAGATAVYAYEDGALETFTRAKRLGLKCIYDLPIAYWETGRRLMQEEAERLPEWAGTLGGGIRDSEGKLQRKQRELELADTVVGPGSFVMDSLPVWSADKKRIVSPFGSPAFVHLPEKERGNGNVGLKCPLRVLFVGSMGQRKGLGDLFTAISLLKGLNVELVVLGSLLAPMEFYRKQLPGFTYEIGRSHQQVLALMRTCDIFCLPSIVEGRALVMQEAMSQGLPIIITRNTGGEDLVIDGKTGFMVPIRSPHSIAEKINWFLEHRDILPAMADQAKQHAQSYTWEAYGKTIVDGIT